MAARHRLSRNSSVPSVLPKSTTWMRVYLRCGQQCSRFSGSAIRNCQSLFMVATQRPTVCWGAEIQAPLGCGESIVGSRRRASAAPRSYISPWSLTHASASVAASSILRSQTSVEPPGPFHQTLHFLHLEPSRPKVLAEMPLTASSTGVLPSMWMRPNTSQPSLGTQTSSSTTGTSASGLRRTSTKPSSRLCHLFMNGTSSWWTPSWHHALRAVETCNPPSQ
mmetsp:Transcript_13702/g.37721  ORF Transcript_13702/g.37721 Transcript_13702/m.37721 type:complete len:222 (-) Transcript_13702:690-1355(-)